MEEKSATFDDFNLKENLIRGIFSYGFENPSHIQTLGIPIINTGKDLIAQAQSGTGKTGTFCIGALNKINEELQETQVLILCPTHELVRQINEVITSLSNYMNVTCMEVIGGTNLSDCRKDLEKSPQVIIGTPGRVLDMIQKKHLFTNKIHTLIFDEADETLSYGFKETIYNIVRTIPETAQICLFSATIPDEILELSRSFMNNPEKIIVKRSFNIRWYETILY